MATAAKHDDDDDTGGISGEYKRPDARTAIKIYKQEIAPKKEHLATIMGDLSDPYARIKDECNFPRTVLDLLFKLKGMEDAKRDHYLLALNLGLSELNITMPRDLVTMAEGTDGGDVIPIGSRKTASMPTIPSDGSETDLADAADDDFTEATEDELAAQTGRSKSGTGDGAETEG